MQTQVDFFMVILGQLNNKEKDKAMEDFRSSEAWRVFRIQSEMIDGIETLSDLGPSVSIFGSARLLETSP